MKKTALALALSLTFCPTLSGAVGIVPAVGADTRLEFEVSGVQRQVASLAEQLAALRLQFDAAQAQAVSRGDNGVNARLLRVEKLLTGLQSQLIQDQATARADTSSRNLAVQVGSLDYRLGLAEQASRNAMSSVNSQADQLKDLSEALTALNTSDSSQNGKLKQLSDLVAANDAGSRQLVDNLSAAMVANIDQTTAWVKKLVEANSDQLRQEIAAANTTTSASMDQISNLVSGLQKQGVGSSASLAKLSSASDDLKRALDGLQAQVDRKRDAAKQEAAQRAVDVKLADLDTANKVLVGEVSNLKVLIGGKADSKQIETAVSGLQPRLDEISRAVGNVEKTAGESSVRGDKVATGLANESAARESLSAKLARIETDLKAVTGLTSGIAASQASAEVTQGQQEAKISKISADMVALGEIHERQFQNVLTKIGAASVALEDQRTEADAARKAGDGAIASVSSRLDAIEAVLTSTRSALAGQEAAAKTISENAVGTLEETLVGKFEEQSSAVKALAIRVDLLQQDSVESSEAAKEIKGLREALAAQSARVEELYSGVVNRSLANEQSLETLKTDLAKYAADLRERPAFDLAAERNAQEQRFLSLGGDIQALKAEVAGIPRGDVEAVQKALTARAQSLEEQLLSLTARVDPLEGTEQRIQLRMSSEIESFKAATDSKFSDMEKTAIQKATTAAVEGVYGAATPAKEPADSVGSFSVFAVFRTDAEAQRVKDQVSKSAKTPVNVQARDQVYSVYAGVYRTLSAAEAKRGELSRDIPGVRFHVRDASGTLW